MEKYYLKTSIFYMLTILEFKKLKKKKRLSTMIKNKDNKVKHNFGGYFTIYDVPAPVFVFCLVGWFGSVW